MARSFRTSRFRRRDWSDNSVDPGSGLTNLSDCMFVLAVGFLVALVAKWNIDISTTQFDAADMQEVEPEELEEDITQEGGDYYIEAGTVWMDPNTGQYYIVQDSATSAAVEGANAAAASNAAADTTNAAGSSESAGSSGGSGSTGSTGSSSSSSGSDSTSGSGGTSTQDITNARAYGAD